MALIWKMLWPEMKTHKNRLVLVLLFGLIISACKGYVPEVLGQLTKAWEVGDRVKAYQLPILIAVLYLGANILRYFHMFWMLVVAEKVGLNMRRRLMNKYLTLNLGFFQNFSGGTGGLISRMLNDVGVIQSGFVKVADIVREPFMAIFMFGYLLYLDWRLTLFIMGGTPLITMVIRTFARSVRKYSKYNLETMEDVTQILKESLDGTRVVQSFNLQDEMRTRFDNKAQEFLKSRAKAIQREEASGPISESISSVFVALLLVYVGHLVLNRQMTVNEFFSFMAAAGFLTDSVRKVQGGYIKIQQAAVAIERLNNMLEETRVVPEVTSPTPFPEHWNEMSFATSPFATITMKCSSH